MRFNNKAHKDKVLLSILSPQKKLSMKASVVFNQLTIRGYEWNGSYRRGRRGKRLTTDAGRIRFIGYHLTHMPEVGIVLHKYGLNHGKEYYREVNHAPQKL